MRIIISPAKKMNIDTDSFLAESTPRFLEDARKLLSILQGMDRAQLQKLWKCSDALVELNARRLQTMDLSQGRTPAIMAYEGIQYQYMAPAVMDAQSLSYLGEHLRILSGLYGILRPFDGVIPYRLEMQAKLSLDGCKDLYGFWGSRLAEQLAQESDFVLNLASQEYSKAVKPYLPQSVNVITCIFGELLQGKPTEKGTLCKMARGQMVRWLAESQISAPEDIRNFDQLGYRFSPEWSTNTEFVFLKSGSQRIPPKAR